MEGSTNVWKGVPKFGREYQCLEGCTIVWKGAPIIGREYQCLHTGWTEQGVHCVQCPVGSLLFGGDMDHVTSYTGLTQELTLSVLSVCLPLVLFFYFLLTPLTTCYNVSMSVPVTWTHAQLEFFQKLQGLSSPKLEVN